MKEYEEEVPEEAQTVSNFESEDGYVAEEVEETTQESGGVMGMIGNFAHSVADFFSSKAHEVGEKVGLPEDMTEKVAGYAEDSADKIKEVGSNVVDSVQEKAKDLFNKDDN